MNGLRTLEIECKCKIFTWKKGETSTIFSLVPNGMVGMGRGDGWIVVTQATCCWAKPLRWVNSECASSLEVQTPSWSRAGALTWQEGRSRYTLKHGTGTGTKVLEDDFAGATQEQVWEARRGVHPPTSEASLVRCMVALASSRKLRPTFKWQEGVVGRCELVNFA